jgi:hypothetical protein
MILLDTLSDPLGNKKKSHLLRDGDSNQDIGIPLGKIVHETINLIFEPLLILTIPPELK